LYVAEVQAIDEKCKEMLICEVNFTVEADMEKIRRELSPSESPQRRSSEHFHLAPRCQLENPVTDDRRKGLSR
jgi:hypothetical protein